METKSEKAVKIFHSGFNCAQAVLTAFAGDYKLDPETAMQISCGFGAGMGKMQKTCGAVTGAFMVLGLHNSLLFKDNKDRKEYTYAMIQTFRDKFVRLNGAIDCSALLKCDLTTEVGRRYAEENKLFEKICAKCVSDAVQILEEMI